jgi:predicted acetyltransferase
MTKMNLIIPKPEHERAAMDFRQEFIDHGESPIHGSWGLHRPKYDNYNLWLSDIEDCANGINNNPLVQVPMTTYFAFIDEKLVGVTQIRHKLTEYLLQTGGHIGYSIRPSERRKGYATQMLSLTLDECRKLGIKKALITCNKANIASANTIKSGGGILENEFVDDEGNMRQRYWITLFG